ncbi:MAG: ABC transporter ATP-binding protein [Chloroflexi bacterium]|nr:ABC transporter ATP-binding protein [Chloroflexota bacterium]
MAYLELTSLQKRFGGLTAVDSVSLAVQEGEFFALLGPSGCGKTTTLRMVAGLVTPDRGSVILGGKDITTEPPRARNLGMVFQSYALFPHLTVFENVAFGLSLRRQAAAAIRERVAQALDMVQLTGMEHRYPKQLSGGQQQRVALARAVVVQPRVLLFDEPLSNLDAKLREHMREEIRALQKRLGITAVYVTHDQTEALAVADRIAVMYMGKVQQCDTPVRVYEQPANELVADFIGQTNLLRGCVKQAGDQLTVVTQHAICVPLARDVNARPGQELALAVRPERIRLVATGRAESPGYTEGQVEHCSYLGSQIQVRVVIQNGALLVNTANLGGPLLQPGQRVGIEIHAEDCIIFAN